MYSSTHRNCTQTHDYLIVAEVSLDKMCAIRQSRLLRRRPCWDRYFLIVTVILVAIVVELVLLVKLDGEVVQHGRSAVNSAHLARCHAHLLEHVETPIPNAYCALDDRSIES